MILRRLKAHIEKENWFAVGLDFLIVVLGVFIGIQVSNWNDGRADRARGDVIRVDLLGDLREDLVELDDTLRATEWRLAAAETILDRAVGWTAPPSVALIDGRVVDLSYPRLDHDWSAQTALFYAIRFTTFDPERESYEGIVTNGDIFLLDDYALIDQLRVHYRRVDGFNDTENQDFRNTVTRLQSELIDQGLSVFDELEWEELSDIVRNDPELRGALKTIIVDALWQSRNLSRLEEETRTLIESLDGGSQ